MEIKISDSIKYVGSSDCTLDLFENQYIIPDGMAYNSYLILDEKTCLMDSTDKLVKDEFFANLTRELNGRKLDYFVVQHLEPDHSATIKEVTEKYPGVKVIMSDRAANMIPSFFPDAAFLSDIQTVKEGDTLSLGEHQLTFLTAPMVHWPEVIVTYESTEKVLFSADGFGKFGAQGCEDDINGDWACEARRYYFNIVGRYGKQVQNLLKKLTVPVEKILPLHGPILTENLGYYIDLYNTWSSYGVEADGVFIAYATLHGHTKIVAEKMADMLKANGCPKVAIADLSRDDIAECVEDSFKYGKVILCASSYDAGVMPKMEELLMHLKSKQYQNRTVALIENTSFAPSANRTMKAILETMKDITIAEPMISVKVNMTEENLSQMEEIAKIMA